MLIYTHIGHSTLLHSVPARTTRLPHTGGYRYARSYTARSHVGYLLRYRMVLPLHGSITIFVRSGLRLVPLLPIHPVRCVAAFYIRLIRDTVRYYHGRLRSVRGLGYTRLYTFYGFWLIWLHAHVAHTPRMHY